MVQVVEIIVVKVNFIMIMENYFSFLTKKSGLDDNAQTALFMCSSSFEEKGKESSLNYVNPFLGIFCFCYLFLPLLFLFLFYPPPTPSHFLTQI